MKKYSKPQILNREKLQMNQAVASGCYYTKIADCTYGFLEDGAVHSQIIDSDYYNEADRIISHTDGHIGNYAEAFPTIVVIYDVDIPGVGSEFYEDYFPHFDPTAARADALEASRPGFHGWSNQPGKSDNWQDVDGMDPAVYTDVADIPGSYDTLVVTS